MQCLTLYPPYSNLIVCLTKETPKLIVLDSLPTNWIETLIAQPVATYAIGESPCKKQCSIATFFQVIQPCLKISAESFNSNNEARGTAGVPNEDDDRILDGNILHQTNTCTRR